MDYVTLGMSNLFPQTGTLFLRRVVLIVIVHPSAEDSVGARSFPPKDAGQGASDRLWVGSRGKAQVKNLEEVPGSTKVFVLRIGCHVTLCIGLEIC